MRNNSGFSRHGLRALRYFMFRSTSRPRIIRAGSLPRSLPRLYRSLRSRHAPHPCVPAVSVPMQCGNMDPLPFGYAPRPLLRSRLTRGRSALPRKPRTFGRKDSHLPLATHSGILPSYPSTAPCGHGFSGLKNAPLPPAPFGADPGLRRRVSAPDIFGAGPLGR